MTNNKFTISQSNSTSWQIVEKISSVNGAFDFIVIDSNVYNNFNNLLNIHTWFNDAPKHIVTLNEQTKSLSSVDALLALMHEYRLDRTSKVLAIGGGIVSDVVGFAASIYMRGIKWSCMPTTLLSMVDAGVGGKVGVNSFAVKNLIGSFHLPEETICCLEFLKTNTQQMVLAGMGEVFKYAVGCNRELFEYLERIDTDNLLSNDVLLHLVSSSLEIKANVVAADFEDNNGARAALNLGHTFGHAIEQLTNYAVEHGVAVAIGTQYASMLANMSGFITESELKQIFCLADKLNLNHDIQYIGTKELYSAMLSDKKAVNGVLNLILPDGIGAARRICGLDYKKLEELRNNYARCRN